MRGRRALTAGVAVRDWSSFSVDRAPRIAGDRPTIALPSRLLRYA